METRNWRSFEDARKYVQSLKLSNVDEWDKYCKSDKKPADIPSAVSRIYKNQGWKGYGDWLGTGRTANQKRNWGSFEDSRKFVQSLKLSRLREWQDYAKTDKRPENIPSDPSNIYKKEWKNWADFLGTDGKLSRNRKFRSFTEARKFVHGLGFKNRDEWIIFYKSDKRPLDIPALPERTYKDEWNGYGDWLGTGTVSTQNKKFRSFTEARKFVHGLGLKKLQDWRDYVKSDKRPLDIPALPERTYKDEFKNIPDWLGTSEKFAKKRNWRSFTEARKFVHGLGFKDRDEWMEYCKSDKRPLDIPVSPERTYEDEFTSVGDWLGTGTVANQEKSKNYLPWKEARQYVRNIKLKNFEDWQKYVKSDKRPSYIPANPQRTYEDEFTSVGDWLGTGSIANKIRSQNYLPWKEAKLEYRRLAKEYELKNRTDWRKFAKSHRKLIEKLKIPINPNQIYTKERELKRMIYDD